ncbi:unnamed protein product [Meganyctiphanes norvegica]|uniref:Uncharacterized protein n=1 Tax=Meganyctiphanes norvegica TaxID=48144 RepID=A0AAV2PHR1_MEGNR
MRLKFKNVWKRIKFRKVDLSELTPGQRLVNRKEFNENCGDEFLSSTPNVYYASLNGCWPVNSLPRDFWKRGRGSREPVILEEVCSSEEAINGSPVGSLRGSPSHRSNDSGYSDSGDSTTANADSDVVQHTPPHVKHITRVYFGDNPQQEGRNRLYVYNDNIVRTPVAKDVTNISRIRVPSPIIKITPTETPKIPNTPVYATPRKIYNNMEEQSEVLEHKSLDYAKSRKSGVPSEHRRVQRCSSSAATPSRRPHRRHNQCHNDQSSQQNHHRTPVSRTRRRWSFSEAQRSSLPTKVDHWSPPIPRSPPINQIHPLLLTPSQHITPAPSSPVYRAVPAVVEYIPYDDEAVVETEPSTPKTVSTGVQFPTPPRSLAGSQKSQGPRKIKFVTPSEVAKELKNSSVQQWVKDLRNLYETECMNTLQSKSLPPDDQQKLQASSASTRDSIRAIQRRAHQVSTEFARLCQRLEWLELEEVPQLASDLVNHIEEFMDAYLTHWTINSDLPPQSSLGRQSKVIQQICGRLTEVCQDDAVNGVNVLTSDIPDSTRHVVQVVTALGHAFTKLVDLMLSREIKVVVRAIEEPPGASITIDSKKEVDVSTVATLSDAVSHLTALGVDGGHICRLIARLGGVKALLGLCLELRLRDVRVAALRALATVCCVVDGIQELEKGGGVEVVAEILCDEGCPEEERSEAAGVLAQITSPWVENNHRLQALHTHMKKIVKALTSLAASTESAEIFLLASAALANLTFLDGGCVSAMRAAGTHIVLIGAQRDNEDMSIFTQDQIATVLANLSGCRSAAKEVVEAGGVGCLLGLLQIKPAPTHRMAEVTTVERVQQKSAIALSRLCCEGTVAQKVVQLGGAERLVQLCKDEMERNHSDAVLVACLAALRKMASALGSEELREMNAAELVEPRLLDSFLTYSSRQESYV